MHLVNEPPKDSFTRWALQRKRVYAFAPRKQDGAFIVPGGGKVRY